MRSGGTGRGGPARCGDVTETALRGGDVMEGALGDVGQGKPSGAVEGRLPSGPARPRRIPIAAPALQVSTTVAG